MPELERPGPAYQQLATILRKKILSGELPEGARVPSSNQLAKEFGVNVGTAHLAHKVLEEEGLVYSKSRSGTYVQPKGNWKI